MLSLNITFTLAGSPDPPQLSSPPPPSENHNRPKHFRLQPALPI